MVYHRQIVGYQCQKQKSSMKRFAKIVIKQMCVNIKKECMKAVKDILDIGSRTNVFIRTHIDCKKWSRKTSDVTYR